MSVIGSLGEQYFFACLVEDGRAASHAQFAFFSKAGSVEDLCHIVLLKPPSSAVGNWKIFSCKKTAPGKVPRYGYDAGSGGLSLTQPSPRGRGELWFDKRPIPQFADGLFDLFAGIHHEGTVGDDGFFERRACDQHKADSPACGVALNFDLLAIVGEYHHADGFYNFVGEFSCALKNVCEYRVSAGDGETESGTGIKLHVHVKRRGGNFSNGTCDSVHFSSYESSGNAILFDDGDVARADFLIAGLVHLLGGGQVDPQLEAVDVAVLTAAGHFFVQDAAPAGHPLDVAFGDGAHVAEAVAVADGAFEHVGDGFDAAMRVRGEAAEGSFERVVEGEVVEEQEGVEFVAGVRTEGAPQ